MLKNIYKRKTTGSLRPKKKPKIIYQCHLKNGYEVCYTIPKYNGQLDIRYFETLSEAIEYIANHKDKKDMKFIEISNRVYITPDSEHLYEFFKKNIVFFRYSEESPELNINTDWRGFGELIPSSTHNNPNQCKIIFKPKKWIKVFYSTKEQNCIFGNVDVNIECFKILDDALNYMVNHEYKNQMTYIEIKQDFQCSVEYVDKDRSSSTIYTKPSMTIFLYDERGKNINTGKKNLLNICPQKYVDEFSTEE